MSSPNESKILSVGTLLNVLSKYDCLIYELACATNVTVSSCLSSNKEHESQYISIILCLFLGFILVLFGASGSGQFPSSNDQNKHSDSTNGIRFVYHFHNGRVDDVEGCGRSRVGLCYLRRYRHNSCRAREGCLGLDGGKSRCRSHKGHKGDNEKVEKLAHGGCE